MFLTKWQINFVIANSKTSLARAIDPSNYLRGTCQGQYPNRWKEICKLVHQRLPIRGLAGARAKDPLSQNILHGSYIHGIMYFTLR